MRNVLRRGRILVCFFLVITAVIVDVGAAESYRMVLERGKKLFREGSYGQALLCFEDARRLRADVFDDSYNALVSVLSSANARSLGDKLEAAEEYVRHNKFASAISAFDLFWNETDSKIKIITVNEALSRFLDLRNFPEAEYWIGKVFRMEGEYSVAIDQFRKALNHSLLLDIPGEELNIRYALADAYAMSSQYKAMEATLLAICADDQLWSGDEHQFTRESMGKLLVSEGVDRFVQLYRHYASEYYPAHKELGVYFYLSGRHARASDHLSFAFLLETTLIVEELRQRDQSWRFSSLSAAWRDAMALPELRERALEDEYFKTIYYFAASLYAVGKRTSAFELWRFVSSVPEAGEWGTRSKRQIQSPYIEETAVY